jgi:hypothetical protein
MSSKVVEADAGIHSLAMAVAVSPGLISMQVVFFFNYFSRVRLPARDKLAVIRYVKIKSVLLSMLMPCFLKYEIKIRYILSVTSIFPLSTPVATSMRPYPT